MITLTELAGVDFDSIQYKRPFRQQEHEHADPFDEFLPWSQAVDPDRVPAEKREEALRFNKVYLVDRLFRFLDSTPDPKKNGVRLAVARHVFGLDGLRTWRAVAAKLEVTPGYVSQIAADIKRELGQMSKEIRDFGESD